MGGLILKNMLDKVKEFRDTLSERIKSPFIGNFMISWSALHWKIFVFLLYNEERITIQQRIEKIEAYLKTQNIWTLIIYPITITFVVLFSIIVFNSIGLFIKLLYDNWMSPIIQKILYNKSIIERSKYEKLRRQYDSKTKEYEEEKELFVNKEKELRELHEKYTSYQNQSISLYNYEHITDVLTYDYKWESIASYSDGAVITEYYVCDKDGFIFENGEKVFIENIRTLLNGNILLFDKRINDSSVKNYLVRHDDYSYYGIENDNIVVSYRRRRENHGDTRFDINEAYKKILQLQELIPKDKFAQKSKQWIYDKSCLVHDYIIGRNNIAVDTYYKIDGWEIQVFGRNNISKDYLNRLIIKKGFLPKSFDQYKMENDRLIYKKFDRTVDTEEVALHLKDLLSRIELQVNNEQ